MKEVCNGCQKETFLVNRKYKLCTLCNHLRLHGETYQETQLKQQQKYQLKQQQKPQKSIRQQSKKQSSITNSLLKVKESIRKEAINSDMYYCWGCGVSGEQLDCSHIISVGKRKDLELDRENINLFCRKCHNNWESGNYAKMSSVLTFEKDLLYIKQNDETEYQRILQKK